jgi:hypothetical protein
MAKDVAQRIVNVIMNSPTTWDVKGGRMKDPRFEYEIDPCCICDNNMQSRWQACVKCSFVDEEFPSLIPRPDATDIMELMAHRIIFEHDTDPRTRTHERFSAEDIMQNWEAYR